MRPVVVTRRRAIAAGILLVALVLAACGGGDEGDGAASTSTTASGGSTTTAGQATTTTGPPAEADAETVALAQAGLFVDDDFPDPWTAGEYGPDPRFETCSDVEGGPEADLGEGAVQQGALFKFGDEAFWVTTRTFAFPTVADATAWLAVIDADTWTECATAAMQAIQDERESGVTVSLRTRDADHLGEQGFESYASFDLNDTDGNLVGASDYFFYQRGALVIRVAQDVGGIADEPFRQAGDDAYRALENAYARVDELQGGSGGG